MIVVKVKQNGMVLIQELDKQQKLMSKKEINTTDWCIICVDLLQQDNRPITELHCNHRFHTDCIEEWKERGEDIHLVCPNCKMPFSESHGASQQDSQIRMEIRQTSIPESQNQIVVLRIQEEVEYYDNRDDIRIHKKKLWGWGLVALKVEIILWFYTILLLQPFANLADLPIVSVGESAKGYIAIGVSSVGIISIGIFSTGIFTFSLMGSGLLMFIGGWGVCLGFGIYLFGVSWYCYRCFVGISIWDTRNALLGVNILGPLFNRNKKIYIIDRLND